MRGKDIHFEPCIFFIDRKCSIYENRPTICRSYGNGASPCVFGVEGCTTAEEIESFNIYQMRKMTEDLGLHQIFESIMNGEAL